ncbi:hypothetical protein SMICM304S_01328 [Streptomyces microflavus]
MSSWTATPWSRARSPMAAASGPSTRQPPVASRRTCAPTVSSRARSFSGSGDRTSVWARELVSMKSRIVVSAMSRPRPITMRWSAVSSISLMRWLESRTVRP